MKSFLLFAVILIGPFQGFSMTKNSPQEFADSEQVLQEIERKLIPILEKRHNMELCAVGGGMPNGKFRSISAGFKIYRQLPKNVIRAIIIDCIQEYLSALNSSEKLRPYLKEYPCTAKNVRISLFFADKDEREFFHPLIGVASASMGEIGYNTIDPENNFKYKETYEEALRLIAQEGIDPKKPEVRSPNL